MRIIQPPVEANQYSSKPGQERDIKLAGSSTVGRKRLILWSFLMICAFVPEVSALIGMAFQESVKEGSIVCATLLCAALGFGKAIKSARNVALRRDWIGLTLVCIFSIVSVLAEVLHLNLTHYLSMVAILGSACLAFGGTAMLKVFSPFLIFMFFWNRSLQQDISSHFSLPLQLVSTQLTVKIAGLFIPITGHGHVLDVKGMRFDIEPGCAGLVMWNSLILAVLLWGMFQKFSARRYCVLLLLTTPLAVVLNSMRLTVMSGVAFATTQQQALQIHTNIEAIFLLLGLFVLWKVGGRLDQSVSNSSL